MGDYSFSQDLKYLSKFGTLEPKSYDNVERRSTLRKMQQAESVRLNRLLHDDSIMTKLSENYASPVNMTYE